MARERRLGWDALRIEPFQDLGYGHSSEAPWFAVGRFDGARVLVDKQALRDQAANDRNSGIRLCPFFDHPACTLFAVAPPGAAGLPGASSALCQNRDRPGSGHPDPPVFSSLADASASPVEGHAIDLGA